MLFRKPVAVKRTREQRLNFVAEAEFDIMQGLNHPHIVAMLDL